MVWPGSFNIYNFINCLFVRLLYKCNHFSMLTHCQLLDIVTNFFFNFNYYMHRKRQFYKNSLVPELLKMLIIFKTFIIKSNIYHKEMKINLTLTFCFLYYFNLKISVLVYFWCADEIRWIARRIFSIQRNKQTTLFTTLVTCTTFYAKLTESNWLQYFQIIFRF